MVCECGSEQWCAPVLSTSSGDRVVRGPAAAVGALAPGLVWLVRRLTRLVAPGSVGQIARGAQMSNVGATVTRPAK